REKTGPVAPPRKSAKPALRSDFSHLRPIVPAAPPHQTRRTAVTPTVERSLAEQILAAGARAKTPTGTGAPKPTGLAAEIIAAGKKRRELA
ncbi:MAG: hypothetical protein ABR885_02990, partial [Mycobacterium sp.]